MQFSNVAKGIKRVMTNIDDDVIEPQITRFYYYNMYYSDDESIKADARVKARGVAGLIAKEKKDARPMDTLQAIAPIIKDNPQAVDVLVSEFLDNRNYDPSDLGFNTSSAQQQLSSSPNPAPSGMQAPAIDGRSAPAQVALTDATVPPNGEIV